MSSTEVIGIVGVYGDLGRQMVVQVGNASQNVIGYDIPSAVPVSARFGIDSKLSASALTTQPELVDNLGDLIHESSIVHWCAPIGALKSLGEVCEDTMVVLHDGVMHTSTSAEKRLLQRPNFAGRIAIVHCLMNPEKTVIIDSDAPAMEEAFEHFLGIGLRPDLMTVEEHDYMMAVMQGLFAVAIQGTSGGRLDEYQLAGRMTPSGLHFKEARDSRDSKWTHQTKESIFRNPELKKLVRVLLDLLENPNQPRHDELDI